MNRVFSRYATPFTVGLFLVSTISGVALFFHWQSKLFHGMHEWLSMLLLVPVILHIQKNWSSMTSYFIKKTVWMPLMLSIAGGAMFLGLALNSPGRPPSASARLMSEVSVGAFAALIQKTPAGLIRELNAKGYAAARPDETLISVARKSGKTVDQLFQDIAPKIDQR